MEAVRDGKEWALLDPNDKSVREMTDARKLWELILETRYRTGEPYVNFIDTANKSLPQAQKDMGLSIKGSNLCNEIHLVTDEERTAVCCLSSVNLEMYDEWKETNMVKDLIVFLDNVLQFFIDNAGDEISKARYSAERERSLGLGAMGLHSYFQKHLIAFDSQEAVDMNEEIFSHIKAKSVEATLQMGGRRGEAPDMVGTGRRNAHMLAIAPNANSSMIVNTSPSIEPWKANAFTSRTRVGSHLNKNPYLEKVLEDLGKNTEEVWSIIITNGGSVQTLDFLDAHLKKVFKTAIELDQHVLIRLAGDRQKYLCQGQSLNIFFPAGADKRYLHTVHYQAWEKGCKGLYYLRTESSNRAENVTEKVKREKLDDIINPDSIKFSNGSEEQQDECIACEG
jgi:ribonucleoside-diphosphate reductase alpha chain